MTAVPSFSEFFRSINGFAPFPWQARLADVVLAEGWPDLLDLPTGSGKTSALDVALYALAVAPERMPRRTLLVVDRRIVVDQGAVHARNVLERMRTRGTAADVIGDRLRACWGAGPKDDPFAVAVLRGGMPRDNDWARRPDQPVLGVATVDQVGSRLLFRGYGISSRSASIHAGLIGNDTLILLDEVHLATPFAETLRALRERYQPRVKGLPARFAVVEMSATAATDVPRRRVFALGADDRAHAVLASRLGASKDAALVPVKVRGDDEASKRVTLAEAAVKHALELQAEGAPVVAVVVNRVDTARLVNRLLRERSASSILVTGRMRPIERDHLVSTRLLPMTGAGRDRATAQPVVVVATQCIEAGADLDFDALITECASLDALRQRFGRLDRRGERKRSRAVILGRSDQLGKDGDDPIYGDALRNTWEWLQARATDDVIDFGVDALPSPDAADAASLSAPVGHSPVLLPAHLDAWSQTAPVSDPDPDVALWLHGPQREVADVQIVWRADATDSDMSAVLAATRPSALESVTVPLHIVRAWLARRQTAPLDDAVASRPPESRNGPPADPSSTLWAFRWRGDDRDGPVKPEDVRPGDVLVVRASSGGMGHVSFDPNAHDPVTDIADLAALRGRGVASLRLLPATLDCWCLESSLVSAVPLPIDDQPLWEARGRIRDWISAWPVEPPVGFIGSVQEWQTLRATLRKMKSVPQIVDGHFVVSEPVRRADLPRPIEIDDAVTEDDDSSFRNAAITLRRHSSDVRSFAERFARAVGLSAELTADVARAGWLHDVGKVDPRFQRWLAGGSEIAAARNAEPLAKSSLPPGNAQDRETARKRAGYPAGYRHELLSLAMIERNEQALAGVIDRDLVLHLVASHHGWCRPFPPLGDHPDDLQVSLDHDGDRLAASTRHRAARLDSGVSDRFWSLTERYGWWGLAWLEAIMRLADHRASESEAGVE